MEASSSSLLLWAPHMSLCPQAPHMSLCPQVHVDAESSAATRIANACRSYLARKQLQELTQKRNEQLQVIEAIEPQMTQICSLTAAGRCAVLHCYAQRLY